jgi:hypothetical protein
VTKDESKKFKIQSVQGSAGAVGILDSISSCCYNNQSNSISPLYYRFARRYYYIRLWTCWAGCIAILTGLLLCTGHPNSILSDTFILFQLSSPVYFVHG